MKTKEEIVSILINIQRLCQNCFVTSKGKEENFCNENNYCFGCYHGDKWIFSDEAALEIAERILE